MKYHYVYSIQNKLTGMLYIGVRSSDTQPKKDLGVFYFSSSHNKEFIEEQRANPSGFNYVVRKVFKTRIDAADYENRLQTKVKAASNPRFYNKCYGHIKGFDSLSSVWYHNPASPSQRIRIFDTEEPPAGWVKGTGVSCKHFHDPSDPSKYCVVKQGESPPSGWVAGRGAIKKNPLRWIHNIETFERKTIFADDPVPDGWAYGFPDGKYGIYHNPKNPSETTQCVVGKEPKGWIRGKGPAAATNKGKVAIYKISNPDETMLVHKTSAIPAGWTIGAKKYGRAAAGSKWFHNKITGERIRSKSQDIDLTVWAPGRGPNRKKHE